MLLIIFFKKKFQENFIVCYYNNSWLFASGRIKCTEKVNDLVRVWRNDVISTVREAAQLALEHINSEEAKEAIHITRILADELKLLTTSSEPPAPTNKVEITSL